MAAATAGINRGIGLSIGWIGIIAAIIGFIYYPVLLGILAIVLGGIALTGPAKGVPATSVGLGIFVLMWPLLI